MEILTTEQVLALAPDTVPPPWASERIEVSTNISQHSSLDALAKEWGHETCLHKTP